jgi:hypothetical protein
MLPNDVTLNSNTYALQTQRANSSIRGDGGRDLDKPVTLAIAHETTNSGKVSSVVYFDSAEVMDTNTCPTPITDNIRVQLKIQYNPKSGRSGIETEIARLITDLNSFMASSDFDRFLNQES